MPWYCAWTTRLTHASHGRSSVFLNGGREATWKVGLQTPVWCQIYKKYEYMHFLKLEGNTRLLMMVVSGCVLNFPSLVFKYSTMSVNFYNRGIFFTFHILPCRVLQPLTFLMIICSPPESWNPPPETQKFLTITGRVLPGVSNRLMLWPDIVIYKVHTWELLGHFTKTE